MPDGTWYPRGLDLKEFVLQRETERIIMYFVRTAGLEVC